MLGMGHEEDVQSILSRVSKYSSGQTEAAKALQEAVLKLAAAVDRLEVRIRDLEDKR
jgi:hypothetical protein